MDTYVKLPNSVRGSFTVSFWFLIKSGGYFTMVSRTDGSLNDPLVQFDLALPGRLSGPYLGLPYRWTGVSSKTQLNLNQWYNVTLVVNGQRAVTYINGNKEGTAEGSQPMPDRPFWILGRSGDGGRAADVAIAHFSLWDRTLSDDEIEIYNRETQADTLPSECLKGPPKTYRFVHGGDVPGSDVGHAGDARNDIPKLKAACDANPACVGINSDGWQKNRVVPTREMNRHGSWQSDPKAGMYFKAEKVNGIIPENELTPV
jgi:hypothetical protein